MKKKLTLVVLVLLLCACVIPGVDVLNGYGSSPSDSDTATRVAQILTAMPTTTLGAEPPSGSTGGGIEPSPSPTLIVTDATATPYDSAPTEVMEALTNTPSSTSIPTQAQEQTEIAPLPTSTITGIPVVQATFLVKDIPQNAITLTPSSEDPRNRLGKPSASDAMDTPTEWGWPTDSDEYSTIQFSGSQMFYTSLKKEFGWRLPMLNPATNLYVETSVHLGKCSGKDSYGIIQRIPDFREPAQGYVFAVSCDGFYRLFKWDGHAGDNGELTNLIAWTASDAIHKGSNQANKLGMMTYKDRLLVYVNGYFLGEARDSSFENGYLGLVIYQNKTDKFSVGIDEVSYWLNPKP